MSTLIVFNGGLMRGESAHWKLRGAAFVEAVRTAPVYRLYSIGDRHPAMVEDRRSGVSVAAELYEVPDAVWRRVCNIEPPGLYRGPVELDDGRVLEGMLGEPRYTLRNGADISHYGGWAAYPRRAPGARMDKDPDEPAFDLLVLGLHMRGLAKHAELGGSCFLGRCRTAPRYRLHSVAGRHPGMYRLADGEPDGPPIEGELYRVSERRWAELAPLLPRGMDRAPVELEDLSPAWGLLFPRELAEPHPDISAYGGWRAYCAARGAPAEVGS
jgi:gamma-glutamylcyclotransferase (GGCT)/AIG2-like uncharacterized protein YtfP